MFGESVRSLIALEAINEHTFVDAFNTAQECVTKRFRFYKFYWLINGREFQQACHDVHKFADQIIDRRFASKRIGNEDPRGQVFLETAKHTLDRNVLRGQTINLLAAGRDTTAYLLSWTL